MKRLVRFFVSLTIFLITQAPHVSAQVTPEARWIAQTGSEVVFVFVHGIFSDSDAGWRHPDGTF
jgi:hypothetical protein